MFFDRDRETGAHLAGTGGTDIRFVIFAERRSLSCVPVPKPRMYWQSSKMKCVAIHTAKARRGCHLGEKARE